MAPTVSNDEQLQFLISCIRFSNNGKVDFEAVASGCKIVSKGAAAKRYERFMKAHNINPNGGSTNNASGSQNEAPSPKKTNKGRGKAKKPSGDDNDDSGTGTPTKRKAASTNNKAAGKKPKVMKGTAVVRAEKLVEQRTGLIKDEQEENGSDTDGEYGRRDAVKNEDFEEEG